MGKKEEEPKKVVITGFQLGQHLSSFGLFWKITLGINVIVLFAVFGRACCGIG